MDEECLDGAGSRHLQAAGKVQEGSGPREAEQGQVRQAQAGLPPED